MLFLLVLSLDYAGNKRMFLSSEDGNTMEVAVGY